MSGNSLLIEIPIFYLCTWSIFYFSLNSHLPQIRFTSRIRSANEFEKLNRQMSNQFCSSFSVYCNSNIGHMTRFTAKSYN